MVPATHPALSYLVTPEGTILSLDGPWDEWLHRDGVMPGSHHSANLVGKNLFSFIQGVGVRHIYAAMHARVLKTGRPIMFEYRCDSPRLRREMSMTIALCGYALRYCSRVLFETAREQPLPQATRGAGPVIAMCSFCQCYRYPLASAAWKDLEDLFKEKELPTLFAVTHGVCESCESRMWLE